MYIYIYILWLCLVSFSCKHAELHAGPCARHSTDGQDGALGSRIWSPCWDRLPGIVQQRFSYHVPIKCPLQALDQHVLWSIQFNAVNNVDFQFLVHSYLQLAGKGTWKCLHIIRQIRDAQFHKPSHVGLSQAGVTGFDFFFCELRHEHHEFGLFWIWQDSFLAGPYEHQPWMMMLILCCWCFRSDVFRISPYFTIPPASR